MDKIIQNTVTELLLRSKENKNKFAPYKLLLKLTY